MANQPPVSGPKGAQGPRSGDAVDSAHRLEFGGAAGGVNVNVLWSQKSFWRDLPELLKDKRNQGQWVCYHGDERIGIGGYEQLIRECVRRGLSEHEYDMEMIEPHASPPWEPKEIEAGGHETGKVDSN